MPCDEMNFPAIVAASLRNQTELAKLLADKSVHDSAKIAGLVEACQKNQALFAEFVAGYTFTLTARRRPPARCSAA